MSEVVTGRTAKDNQTHFDQYAVTDCRSLYDAAQRSTPILEEKRCIIDVVAIRDALGKNKLLWTPTGYQLADGLTKLDWDLLKRLSALMEETLLILRDTEG